MALGDELGIVGGAVVDDLDCGADAADMGSDGFGREGGAADGKIAR